MFLILSPLSSYLSVHECQNIFVPIFEHDEAHLNVPEFSKIEISLPLQVLQAKFHLNHLHLGLLENLNQTTPSKRLFTTTCGMYSVRVWPDHFFLFDLEKLHEFN